ncbi:hypothetical protein ACWEN3_32780 [Streptomyces sp. NPDC004561]
MSQHDVTGHAWGDAPIYDRLVQERGDIPADVNAAATRLLRETDRAINFGSLLS